MKKVLLSPRPFLFPVPAVVVSCGLQKEKPNAITIAWVGTVCSNPPLVSISIQPHRYSHAIIKEAGYFGINIPKASQVRIVDYCGIYSGKNVDKFAECGLTPFTYETPEIPLIKEFPVNLACEVKQILSLGTHDLFLGEILQIHVDEEFIPDGKLDLSEMQPIAYLAGQYFGLGEILAMQGYAKKHG